MEKLVKFLEKHYGDLSRYPAQNLEVSECAFSNGQMHLADVKVVGDSECFDGDEFYQYVLADGKLYKAYFEMATDDDGEELDIDCIDYGHAYKIVDVTEDILDLMQD